MVYEFYQGLGRPYLTDILYQTVVEGADHWYDQLLDEQQMMSLAHNWMYDSDSWPTAAPNGWLEAEDRVFHTEPYINSVEDVTEHIANQVN